MNDLVVKGEQEFMGIHIKVMEGGFGKGKRVLTDKMIAEIHGMETKNVRARIIDNISRFKENVDYIDLKQRACEISTLDLTEFGYAKQSITQAEHIYLLSERGYGKLIKIMDTDKAWEVHDKLQDEYFTMREEIRKLTKKEELALRIFKGGADGIEASKELLEIEKEEVRKQERNGNNKTMTCKQAVDMIGIKGLTTTILNNWMVEKGLGEWVKFGNDKYKTFQPTENYKEFVAGIGCSYTGTTDKGKIRMVYTTLFVDRIFELHLASLIQFTRMWNGEIIQEVV